MNSQAGMQASKVAEAPPEDVQLRNQLLRQLEVAEQQREFHHTHLREQSRVAAACRAALETLDGEQDVPAQDVDRGGYGGSV